MKASIKIVHNYFFRHRCLCRAWTSSMLSMLVFLLMMSCNGSKQDTLFEKIEPSFSGFKFENRLLDKEGIDIFRFRNYYNGGGVGIGDIDNDGLPDVYLISNQGENKLYRNKGDFKFEDITSSAGVGGKRPWSTGVAIADVDGDGWLDVYVCNSGELKGNDRQNELFINNQDGTFTDRASEFGLADNGFSIHAVFFDFDQDGDLDCYLLNNSSRPVSNLPVQNTRNVRDEFGGDKFFVNNNGKFLDESESLGIYGSVIGFGLCVTLLDVNEDSWTDIYVSNDFFERDYLYVSMKGERFEESLEKYFDHTSLFSMGGDAGDLNNDGLDEVFVTDMLPPELDRLKQTTSFESYNLQQLKIERGFFNQYMKNALQLNNGDGTFSEVGRYAGVSATDWSWGTLLVDLENDGYKEIFVTNGIFHDITDQDFIEYFSSEENLKAAIEGNSVDFEKFARKMPSTPLPNAVFKRDSAGLYYDTSERWGLATPSFSNGAAYGDLDNDGDLDLVVNNLNQEAFLYRNNTNTATNHFLKFLLKGDKKNPFAIGARVNVHAGNSIITYSHFPNKGYESSMDYTAIVGIGPVQTLDSVEVIWNSDLRTVVKNVTANSTLSLKMPDAQHSPAARIEVRKGLFTQLPLNCNHYEDDYVDFDINKLIYHQLSREGPPIAVADLNGDGLDDFYFGAAIGFEGAIYVNTGNNTFEKKNFKVFSDYKLSEDVDAVFFDADGDGDKDLYVVSGGNEYSQHKAHFADRLYTNVSNGRNIEFVLNRTFGESSGSCVRPADFDRDGDIDLFIGIRSVPDDYGMPASSYLLENDGKGNFSNVTQKKINQLDGIGMVTDAVWSDYDADGDQDLVIVGDWMPIVVFENRQGFFQRKFNLEGLVNTEGWWNTITSFDYNEDGLPDFIAGNLGLNSRFKASEHEPIRLYIADFDNNGKSDPIYAFAKAERFFPFHLRNDLSTQLPLIKKRFPSFKEYADKSMDEIFTQEELDNTVQLNTYQLGSMVFINRGDGTFGQELLPRDAQYAPIYQILPCDIDANGKAELLLMGNFSGTKPEEGAYDANHGLVLEKKDGNWQKVSSTRTGLVVKGNVKAVRILNGKNSKLLLVGKNNNAAELYAIR